MRVVRKLASAALLAAIAALLPGCSDGESAAPPSTTARAGSPTAPQVTLSIGDRADYDALLETLRGKVVLVDFWATWCVPCVEQFPHTVDLYRQYSAEQLAVVSVSMDEPDDEKHVRAFLQAQGASFHNLLSKYGVGAEGFDAFAIEDGAVPHYKVYDRSGALRFTASSGDKIDDMIKQLLDEGRGN